ncbi:MAG TPA: thermonuclease family protein [Microvirga sp.]|jgi:endonuclease YncB( thermonuclease family)|nr:thermonuclease family protein [Microvirga sp.]
MTGLWAQLQSLVIAAVMAVAAWFGLEPDARVAKGIATVTDGDTVRLNGAPIRLKGVDAPEMRQSCRRDGRPYPCGEVSKQALVERLEDRTLTCRITGRDRYRRALAFCAVEGEDVGAWLVEQGLAVGYGDYEREEARARSRRLGLWAGEFQRPAEWRREHGPRGA